MGGSLSTAGLGGKSRGPGCSKTDAGVPFGLWQHSNGEKACNPPTLGLCCLGTLDEGAEAEGAAAWRLGSADLQAAALGGEGGLRGSCMSPAFPIPQASLPAACKGLLAEHRWCLVCRMARGGALSLGLRWLGGPSFPGTSSLSVCCELQLGVRCLDGNQQQVAGSRQWLQHAFNAAQPEAAIHGVMAAGALAACAALVVEIRFEGAAVHVQAPLPGLVVHEAPLMLKVSEDPALLVVDAFLSPRECADLRELGGPSLKRSKVSAGDETPLRTSWGMFCTGPTAVHPVARHLDERVLELTRLACQLEGRRPLVLGEATQIVRYDPGQYYALHLDNKAGDCARRAATVMVYLSDVEAGGATSFPRSSGFPLERAVEACAAGWRNEPAPPDTPQPAGGSSAGNSSLRIKERDPEGLRIQPREGRLVLFWSRMPNGEEDKCSLHEAEKVVKGTKWICTRWCREA